MAQTLPRAEFAVSTSSAANDRPSIFTAVRPAAPARPPRRNRTETATSAAATRPHSKSQSTPQYPSPKSMPDGRFHHSQQRPPRFEPILVPRTTAAVSACPTTAPDVRRIAHSHRFSRIAPSPGQQHWTFGCRTLLLHIPAEPDPVTATMPLRATVQLSGHTEERERPVLSRRTSTYPGPTSSIASRSQLSISMIRQRPRSALGIRRVLSFAIDREGSSIRGHTIDADRLPALSFIAHPRCSLPGQRRSTGRFPLGLTFWASSPEAQRFSLASPLRSSFGGPGCPGAPQASECGIRDQGRDEMGWYGARSNSVEYPCASERRLRSTRAPDKGPAPPTG